MTIDGGATASFINVAKAKSLKMKIHQTSQDAIQADGVSQLVIMGEVNEKFNRNKVDLTFDALVCENKNGTDILGGMNFLYDNSVVPDARRQTISVGKMVFPETNPLNVAKALAINSLDQSSPFLEDSQVHTQLKLLLSILWQFQSRNKP